MPFWQFEFFNLFCCQISTWLFFVSLAFFVGLVWLFRRMHKTGILKSEYKFVFWGSWLIFFVFLSARFFNWLENGWPIKDFFDQTLGGISFFGGFLGALVYALLTIRFLKTNFLKTFNLAVIPLSLTMALGRIGCFLIKDHPGTLTGLPWAVIWPDGQTRHPVALYLILSNLALCFLLVFLERKKTFLERLGSIFLLWLGASRFLLDFTRLREELFWHLGLSQILALFVFCFGASLFFRRLKIS